MDAPYLQTLEPQDTCKTHTLRHTYPNPTYHKQLKWRPHPRC